MAKVADLVRQASVIDARKESDTIRLWESYRDQALMWRSIALLQIPGMVVLAMFAIMLWFGSETIVNVPARPLPGIYSASEIPDAEFIDVATKFVNLTATYQPMVASAQFNEAAKLLVEPVYTKFREDVLTSELKTIEQTQRTQVFFSDPTKTKIERSGGKVNVILSGDRIKTISGRQLDPASTSFRLTLALIPRTDLNPYGIVIEGMAVGKGLER